MPNPTNRDIKLVSAVAHALADYHGERRGNFGCHVQAACLLIEHGPLAAHSVSDFLIETIDPPSVPPGMHPFTDANGPGT